MQKDYQRPPQSHMAATLTLTRAALPSKRGNQSDTRSFACHRSVSNDAGIGGNVSDDYDEPKMAPAGSYVDWAPSDAKRWRKLAAEVWAVAQFMQSPEARRLLESIAANYDRLADRAERRSQRTD
jgi:hypothetical protein